MNADEKYGARLFGLTLLGWLVVVVLAALVAAGAWAIRVATSDIRGRGDAAITKNSARNWTSAQARFEQLSAEFDSTLVRIDILAPQAAERPDDRTIATQLNGLRSYCTSVAADFNADARSYLAEDFRSADLPISLDPTECA